MLAGGGAFGAYEVGVLEALFNGRWANGRHGAIEGKVYTGTSVGAFNAAFLAAAIGISPLQRLRALRQIWIQRIAELPGGHENGVFRYRGSLPGYLAASNASGTGTTFQIGDFFHDVTVLARNWVRRGLDITTSLDPLSRKIARLLDLGDLISNSPLKRLIRDTIEPESLFRPEAHHLQIVATQWDSGNVVIFENQPAHGKLSVKRSHKSHPLTPGNLGHAIRASAAIPGLFRPISIEQFLFADGGVLMNAPLRPALAARVSELHVIHLDSRLDSIPHGRAPSTFETFERILAAVPATMINGDLFYAQRVRSLIQLSRKLDQGTDPDLTSETKPASGEASADERSRSLQEEEILKVIRKYKNKNLITIHQHFPKDLAENAFQLLDFRLDKLLELIDLGFSDAVQHDCEANGCIV